MYSTFKSALDVGINFFDSAEVYNQGGSERTIGRLIGENRERLTLATKFFPYPWRVRKSDLDFALRSSLSRMNINRVDLYMIHFPLPPIPLRIWIDALGDALESGLTRAVGVSNCNSRQMKHAYEILKARGIPLASNQVEFNLFRRKVEQDGLLNLCHELNITLVAYRPIASGQLSRLQEASQSPMGLRSLLDVINKIAAEHKKTISQVALNWILCKGAIPIPGARNPEHIIENSGAAGWRLSNKEVSDLDAVMDKR